MEKLFLMKRSSKRVTLTQLSIKFTRQNIFSKLVVIINASIVLGLAIFIASISIGFLRYQKAITETNSYYNVITMLGDEDFVNDILSDPNSHAIEEVRLIYHTIKIIHDIDGLLLDEMQIPVSSLTSTTDLLLLTKERESGFQMIGDDFDSPNQAILPFFIANYIAQSLEIGLSEMIGMTIDVSEENQLVSYSITGVISEEATLKMGIFSSLGIIVNSLSDTDIVEQISIQSSEISVLEYYITNYEDRYSSKISFLDELYTQQAYTRGISTALMVMAVISTMIGSAIIYESVSASFHNSLPFYSMMKIIGLRNGRISIFLIIETIFSIFIGFLFSIPFSYAISWLVNDSVDVGSIFGIQNMSILSLDFFAILITFVTMIALTFLLLTFQIRKLNRISISERTLNELEFLS